MPSKPALDAQRNSWCNGEESFDIRMLRMRVILRLKDGFEKSLKGAETRT